MRTNETGEIITAETIADALKLIRTRGADVKVHVAALGLDLPISKKIAKASVSELIEHEGQLYRPEGFNSDDTCSNTRVDVYMFDVAQTDEEDGWKLVTIQTA